MLWLAAVLLPVAAVAVEPGYAYFSGEYITRDPGDARSVDGFLITGTMPLGERWHIAADHAQMGNRHRDLTQTSVALGTHLPVMANSHLFGRVGVARSRIENAAGGDQRRRGVAAAVGLRTMVTPGMEISAQVSHGDFGTDLAGDAESWLGFGGVFHYGGHIALNAGFRLSQEQSAYHAGLRLTL